MFLISQMEKLGQDLGSRGGNTLVCVMPIFTALALFMIAEIDVPGKGIIQVVPDNLRALIVTLEHGGLTL